MPTPDPEPHSTVPDASTINVQVQSTPEQLSPSQQNDRYAPPGHYSPTAPPQQRSPTTPQQQQSPTKALQQQTSPGVSPQTSRPIRGKQRGRPRGSSRGSILTKSPRATTSSSAQTTQTLRTQVPYNAKKFNRKFSKIEATEINLINNKTDWEPVSFAFSASNLSQALSSEIHLPTTYRK